jgi:hypothetical protein
MIGGTDVGRATDEVCHLIVDCEKALDLTGDRGDLPSVTPRQGTRSASLPQPRRQATLLPQNSRDRHLHLDLCESRRAGKDRRLCSPWIREVMEYDQPRVLRCVS